MNLLTIASILPITNTCHYNDYVLRYVKYIGINYQIKTSIIKPVLYSNKILGLISKKWKRYSELTELKSIDDNIYLLPYLSIRKYTFIHSILSISLYLLNIRKINNIVYKDKPDIIHCHFLFPDSVLALFLKYKFNIPYIITLQSEYKYFHGKISCFISRIILNNAFQITTVNCKMYQQLYKEGYKKSKLIPIGLDKKFLKFNRVVWPDNNVIRIITIGSLIKLKNIDKVLLALNNLWQYKFEYTIVGNGIEKEHLYKIVQNSKIINKVTFIDSIPYSNIPQILSKNDLFVLISYPESFGRVYFESMAVGLPIICAKDSGAYGYFSDWVEGVSVNHDNQDELIKVLLRFFNNPELINILGKNAKRLSYKYTLNEVVNSYFKIYNKATERI